MGAGCSAIFLVLDLESHIKSGADPSTLTEPGCEVHNNFLSLVIISDFKCTNVTMLYHHSQKPDDDFGAQPNKHLAFASLFSVVDTLESISQDIHAPHYVAQKDGRKSPCFSLPLFYFFKLEFIFLEILWEFFQTRIKVVLVRVHQKNRTPRLSLVLIFKTGNFCLGVS